MAVTYQVVGCSNPKGAEGVEYATNRTVKTGDYTFKELAEDIQFATTVTHPDVVAVLTAMKEYIRKHLLQGQRIIMDELGSWSHGIAIEMTQKRRQDNFWNVGAYLRSHRHRLYF